MHWIICRDTTWNLVRKTLQGQIDFFRVVCICSDKHLIFPPLNSSLCTENVLSEFDWLLWSTVHSWLHWRYHNHFIRWQFTEVHQLSNTLHLRFFLRQLPQKHGYDCLPLFKSFQPSSWRFKFYVRRLF